MSGRHATNVELTRKPGQTLAAAINTIVAAGETPKALAARMGVTESTISALRRPKYTTPLAAETAAKIAALFGCSVEDMLAGRLTPPGPA